MRNHETLLVCPDGAMANWQFDDTSSVHVLELDHWRSKVRMLIGF